MTGWPGSATAAVLLAAVLTGCMSSPGPGQRGPNSEDMSADQFGQTDFNRTVTLEAVSYTHLTLPTKRIV